MSNFLLLSAYQRTNKRRQKRKDKDTLAAAAAGGNTTTTKNKQSRLPTRAMIQLLKGRAKSHDSEESDMSTFDTTTKHHNNNNNHSSRKQRQHTSKLVDEQAEETLFPILRPTASGTGLEVDFSTTPPASHDKHHNNYNNNQHQQQQPEQPLPLPPSRVTTPPQCPLSPLTIASTRDDETDGQRALEQRDPSNSHLLLLPTETTHGTTTNSINNNKQTPPRSLPQHATISTSIPTSTSNSSSNFTSTTTTTTTTPSLWQDLWQRCIADCYCISASNNNNTVLVDDQDPSYDNTTNDDDDAPNYFQFLSCVEEDELPAVVPKLCEQLRSESPKLRSKALTHLSHLCDRDHEYNRIPLVCSCDQYGPNNNCNIVQVVCETILLDSTTTSWKTYRQALLILSNLTLPLENKAVLLLGPLRELLLQCLYQGLRVGHYHSSLATAVVITPSQQQQQLEVHLVCAILFNLSFLNDGKAVLWNYVPPNNDNNNNDNPCTSSTSSSLSPLDNPHSLLRVLERMMKHFQPYAHKAHDSVERQALRWTLGMMRNLCQTQEDGSNGDVVIQAARIIGQTTIPLIALELLRDACHSHNNNNINPEDKRHRWRPQSLEDLALGLLVELALRENDHDAQQLMALQQQQEQQQGHSNVALKKRPVLVPALYPVQCRKYLEPLMRVGGIHGVRAQAIVKRFDHGNVDNHNIVATSNNNGSSSSSNAMMMAAVSKASF